MTSINLIRFNQYDIFDENRICGKLIIIKNDITYEITTLESREYIFKDGTYQLVFEYSPKFKQNLWEFKGIKGRTEIKFHNGNSTSHTRGCVLLKGGTGLLHTILCSNKTYKINVKTI